MSAPALNTSFSGYRGNACAGAADAGQFRHVLAVQGAGVSGADHESVASGEHALGAVAGPAVGRGTLIIACAARTTSGGRAGLRDRCVLLLAWAITAALTQFKNEGHRVYGPTWPVWPRYMTAHIRRFGDYVLDLFPPGVAQAHLELDETDQSERSGPGNA